MIYHVFFGGVDGQSRQIPDWCVPALKPLVGKRIDGLSFLANIIKQSEEDSFIFILVNKSGQEERFNKWVEEYELDNYIIFTPPTLVTNGVHPENGPNLRLVVMASSNHPMRDMFIVDESEDNHED